ncbi:OmpA family protein [Paracoccus saliphilus]|uniref:OmpA family protein n=1 Tax=Paracoccus saliphilus TaxID=405559 RepID=A0AA46A6B8_9RHOB|nr:OmpA family protein [Paracoccus saliphilus]WCR05567.1 OmpA family protein [Paracoccus saliphilus]SIS95696.1 OmpA family protein [Paracoccus saliphilus]
MKRIARNTTAIVTCLSMLMPHLVWAEASDEKDFSQRLSQELERKQEQSEKELKRKAEEKKKAAEAKREERKERQEAKREKRKEAQARKAREEDKKAAEAKREERKERQEAKREKRKKAQARKAREEDKKAAEAKREERKERQEAKREKRKEAQARKAREEDKKAAEKARQQERKAAEKRRAERREAEERRAEKRRTRSAAAREAAEAARAPEAAALHSLLGSGSGDVIRQVITDGNSRSSDEDFATSLRDAMSGDRNKRRENESRWRKEERKRQEARDDDDDDNDLTKALLLGLGALAVGSMLNNNRQVALSSPDRVVTTRPDGSQEIVRDDVALLRQPGSNVETERFDDGSSRTVVTRADGSKVVTIRDANMQILRRTLISPDGRTSRLIDDTEDVRPVDIDSLPEPAPVTELGNSMDEEALRAALNREANIDRRFTLGQIRNIPEVRSLVATVDIPAITFDTGSAAIPPGQAEHLSALGRVMEDRIRENPREMYMVEGYTDTVGDSAMNLALSDRRAESVALALTEYFDVPPENLVVQGYGEEFLKTGEAGDVRANRRSSVRRITDLLQTASSE